MNGESSKPSRNRLFHAVPSLEELENICSAQVNPARYPLAAECIKNVPIYDATMLDPTDDELVERLSDEFYDILLNGSGVFVLRGMYQDQELLLEINKIYRKIIESEKAFAKGDHFGNGNERIWNSLEKHGKQDPATFYQYYSNPWLKLISNAWLGPGYRVTAQVNIVKPGGQPQSPHRDYHLGFLDEATTAKYPTSMQVASQLLTLQGAVAHTKMPLESGPTRFLPFSQQYRAGYVAYRRPEFVSYFANKHISLPLGMGDGVFFNPALFHGAGENTSDSLERIANLLQVSSAFGKPMELVQSIPLLAATWGELQGQYRAHGWTAPVRAYIASVAEGYPFPLNLDKHPPRPGGMAPASEQEVVESALAKGWSAEQLVEALEAMRLP